MGIKVLGWTLFVVGFIGLIQSLISLYAEHKIRQELKFMREDEKQMFLNKKKQIIRIRVVSLIMLIIGILIVF